MKKKPVLADLILQSDTDCMAPATPDRFGGPKKASAANSIWKSTRTPNLKIYTPSGVYFAHLRVNGKLIRKSLGTTTRSVAELRLGDLVKNERAKNEGGTSLQFKGKMTIADALELYRSSVKNNVRTKDTTKHYREQTITALLRSWPGIEALDVSRITEAQCEQWAGRFSKTSSPMRFNNTVGTLRGILEKGVAMGARYTNPAKAIKRMRVRNKPLNLPSIEEFSAFVEEIRNGGGWCSEDCADFVEFLAYSGCRKGEAERATWGDVSFQRSELRIKGDRNSGTKNWEYRTIPMIPALKKLLLKMRSCRPDAPVNTPICRVKEAQRAMDRAAKICGIRRMTHHNLRDLYATTCLEQESPVPVAVLAQWLGHKDGGVLALKRYIHPRQGFGADAASKVNFHPTPPSE